ncbi:MAG TPA: GNAT family N-acetyltransferase [Steroidobacteraceae bacterium]|nr:GNAT family N-acetyltransferase [Steroidobacteraceae bacterium]
MAGYPRGWERAAITRDGESYRIRPIREDDADRDRAFIRTLSPEARYRRMMISMRDPSPDLLEHLVHVDYLRDMAFVAVLGQEERIIGVARYADDGTPSKEFAVAVLDEWQARGVAATLSLLLIEYARAHGVGAFHALIMASNQPMIDLARWLGMSTSLDTQDRTMVRASRTL